ncbi:MAG: hypothetical protein JO010_10600 [Alphaproteobacteria bacterium]|nr:hypothetical protein [Alphaproteobacteria bacterium]
MTVYATASDELTVDVATGTPDWGRFIAVGLVILLFSIALAALVPPILTIDEDFEKIYSEGWNAYHAARAAAGEKLYSGDLWRPVNYPFLSFYLVAWLKPLFGNVLIIGRGLNLAGLAAQGVLGALILRRFGGGAVEMVFAAACILGFQQIQAPAWIVADEPQMLAEAFMLAGLLCHLSGRPGIPRLAGTALLLATGGFIKHILVAIPIAVTLDLWWNERRWFLTWCVCLLAAAGAYLGLTYLIAGGDFLHELFAARQYAPHPAYHLRKFLIAFKVPFAVCAIFLACRLPGDRAVLLRSYGVAAMLAATLFSATEGVAYNVYLDVAVFMGIAAPLAFKHWHARSRPRPGAYLIAALLPAFVAMPILTRLATAIHSSWKDDVEQPYEAEETLFREAAAFLRAHEGPALCESLLMCLEAGKPLLIDPFMARSLILAKQLDEAKLVAQIAAHRFAVIELPTVIYPEGGTRSIQATFFNPPRFTERTLEAIDRFYRVAPDNPGSDYVFYVPKPE